MFSLMSVGRVVVFLAIAIGGLAMAGSGGNMILNEQSDVQQAVTVEGTVKSTNVTKMGDSVLSAMGGSVSSANNPTTSGWKPVIRYTYTYDGEEYTSDSVYPGPEKTFKFEENARSVATRVSPGQTVTVYVNQKNPSRAFLINETGGNLFPLFLIGIGAVVGVPFLLAVRKEIGRGVKGG